MRVIDVKRLQAKKKQRKTRLPRILAVVFGVLVLLSALGGGTVLYVLHKPLPPTTFTPATLPQPGVSTAPPLSWPAYGQAAYGAVGYGVLATHGEQTGYATASVAKVMTAYAVLKQKPLKADEQGPAITLSQADVDIYNRYVAMGGSVVPVAAGAQLTEYQALQALLLPSANNIADTLAIWSSGSVEAFAAYANQQAKELGLTTFVMTDPSGLAAETRSSAADLVRLGIAAIQEPVIAEISNQKTAVIPVAGTIHNYNTMLGREGINGLKTGNNDADPGAYLFTASRTISGKPVTIVGAVMGAGSLYQALTDSLPLLTSGDGGFGNIPAIASGTKVGSFTAPWQGPVTASTVASATFVGWLDTSVSVTAGTQNTYVKATKGSKTGTVTAVNAQDKATKSVDVVLDGAITKPDFWWRLQHAF